MKKLLQNITGFSTTVIQHLEIADQNRISLMGGIMIFTSLVSATIMSYAFAVMSFHNPYLIPVIFFLWFIFVYFFERLIISGKKINKLVMITRFIAALAFAMIHSLIIDVLFFQQDIQESFMNQNKVMAARISKDYDAKITSKTKLINELMVQNQVLSDKIVHLRNQIVSEADGSSGTRKVGMGPIFDLKKRILLPEIRALNKNIADNKRFIDEYKNEIQAFKIKMGDKINKIIPPNQHGLLTNIRQLNQIEFVHGDFISRLFATLFLLIFIFVETLPLFAKLSLDISSYYNILDIARAERQDTAFIYYEQTKINETNKTILLSTNQRFIDNHNLNIKRLSSFNDFIRNKTFSFQAVVREIEEKKEEYQKKYPHLTDLHIKPFFDGIYKQIKNFYNNFKIQLS